MAAVELQGVAKSFGDVVALQPTDLTIAEGEFFSVLGPSGSGKTTVLRLIAGFETPDQGTVRLGGVDVTAAAPFERDVNTVFQDYALFPHMSVRENIEYGPKVKGVARDARAARAEEMLDVVRLAGLGDRRPGQLSGGQRQRVALARALINEPKVLLLDEPLGALDLKLREEMQVELKTIQRRVGITFVYVTHDQGEALSMSDRVAVFSAGRLEQIGSPEDVYERPASEFVAGFVGTNNVLPSSRATELFPGLAVSGTMTALRPESIDVRSTGDGPRGEIIARQYLGADTRLHVAVADGTTLICAGPSGRYADFTVGQIVSLGIIGN